MVVDWEQETGLLMSSGDVRIVRIWDTDRETKVQVTTPGHCTDPTLHHAYNCMLLLTKWIPSSSVSGCHPVICGEANGLASCCQVKS